jgi:hypothetical protein
VTAPFWMWAAGAGGRPRRSGGPPGNGTRAGAVSPDVTPAGSTCTTSSTGQKGGQTKLDSPTLPGPAGEIAACHAADITPSTIIPAWYGDRLDLDHAIYVCFANAENQARRAQQATAA